MLVASLAYLPTVWGCFVREGDKSVYPRVYVPLRKQLVSVRYACISVNCATSVDIIPNRSVEMADRGVDISRGHSSCKFSPRCHSQNPLRLLSLELSSVGGRRSYSHVHGLFFALTSALWVHIVDPSALAFLPTMMVVQPDAAQGTPPRSPPHKDRTTVRAFAKHPLRLRMGVIDLLRAMSGYTGSNGGRVPVLRLFLVLHDQAVTLAIPHDQTVNGVRSMYWTWMCTVQDPEACRTTCNDHKNGMDFREGRV